MTQADSKLTAVLPAHPPECWHYRRAQDGRLTILCSSLTSHHLYRHRLHEGQSLLYINLTLTHVPGSGKWLLLLPRGGPPAQPRQAILSASKSVHENDDSCLWDQEKQKPEHLEALPEQMKML